MFEVRMDSALFTCPGTTWYSVYVFYIKFALLCCGTNRTWVWNGSDLSGSLVVSMKVEKCFKNNTNLSSAPGFLPPKAGGENAGPEFAFKDQMEMMVKRGIVEECCHKPCNIFDLQNYCNWRGSRSPSPCSIHPPSISRFSTKTLHRLRWSTSWMLKSNAASIIPGLHDPEDTTVIVKMLLR